MCEGPYAQEERIVKENSTEILLTMDLQEKEQPLDFSSSILGDSIKGD
jgi:hypothetical protein